jgi:hypothetical protein
VKPILSENGSIELMFGGVCIVGSLFGGERPFVAGILFAIGVGLVVYGASLRKAWNSRISEAMRQQAMQREVDKLRDQQRKP